MNNRNLPVVVRNNMPAKMKKGMIKIGKVVGSTLAFTTSLVAVAASAMTLPILIIPSAIAALYTSQKLLNNTIYKSYKDLAFIVKKSGKNMKIYQDVRRSNIFIKMRGLDKRGKLGFLQLQALVGMSKFNGVDKKGNPVTIETDSHGVIRKTFQTLSQLGYIKNYEETYKGKSKLILPKLAFANGDIGEEVAIYNMQFQRTDKPIDFEDETLRRMFPMIFSKRGLLAKQGYEITRDEEGRMQIDYHRTAKQKRNTTKKETLRERVAANISLEEQRSYVKSFLETPQAGGEEVRVEQNGRT